MMENAMAMVSSCIRRFILVSEMRSPVPPDDGMAPT